MARQQRRALSTIVGALLFLVILVAAFGSLLTAMSFMTTFQQKSIDVASANVDQINEIYSISTRVDTSCKLIVTVQNSGTIDIQIVELFVINSTDNGISRYDVLNALVAPGNSRNATDPNTLSLNGVSPQTITLTTNKSYEIKVVTERGTSQSKSVSMPATCNVANVLIGELVAAPPEIASNEEVTVAFVVVNRGESELQNVELAGSPSYDLTVNPPEALVSQTLLTPGLENSLIPGGSVVFKWSIILKGGIGTNITLSTSASASGGDSTGTESAIVKITKEYQKEIISQKLVAKPEIFMIVPSPFGDSTTSQGLWGVVVANPIDANIVVTRLVISITPAITDRTERIIDNTGSACPHTAISPTTDNTEWSCPEENLIQWTDSPGVTVGARDVGVFLARYEAGDLGGGGDDPAFQIAATIFTSFGQFNKGAYITGMEQTSGAMANVYPTTATTGTPANALINANIRGSATMSASATNQTINIALTDFSITTQSISSGSSLIVNIPAGFTVVGVPTVSTKFNVPTVTQFVDGSYQIVAITNAAIGGSGAEAAIMSITVNPPDIGETRTYIMYALAQGSTSSTLVLGPLAEIPIRVTSP